jgi:hypothetical protein
MLQVLSLVDEEAERRQGQFPHALVAPRCMRSSTRGRAAGAGAQQHASGRTQVTGAQQHTSSMRSSSRRACVAAGGHAVGASRQVQQHAGLVGHAWASKPVLAFGCPSACHVIYIIMDETKFIRKYNA